MVWVPHLEMVFSCLATHVKDVQGTGTLHAAAGTVDMQGQTTSTSVSGEEAQQSHPSKAPAPTGASLGQA